MALARKRQFQPRGAFPGSRKWLVLLTHFRSYLLNCKDSNIIIPWKNQPFEVTLHFKGHVVFTLVLEELSSRLDSAVCCICCPRKISSLCHTPSECGGCVFGGMLYILKHYRDMTERLLQLLKFKCFR